MKLKFGKYKELTLIVTSLLFIFFIQRILFLFFNYEYFSQNSTKDLFKALLWGMRFDLWTIFAFNGLLIFINLLPLKNSFRNFSFTYFIIVNSILSLFNLIDIEYFPFTLKRSTADLFSLISTGNDVWILLPEFLLDYWYIIIIWLIIVLFLWIISEKIFKSQLEKNNVKHLSFWFSILNILIVGLIMFVVLRGTRLRPVSLLSASLYSNSNLVPVVLNTPYSIVKTLGKPMLKKHVYFQDETELIFNPIYVTGSNTRPYKKNVVILILESFSKEHIGFFNKNKKQSFTPFLDSLLKQSLVIRYSFANGRKSIESLPSILAGIPSLMEVPYILSPFSSNEIDALPNILKRNGYATSFYHGGTNGTMGFDVFSAMAGVEKYYGRWQYPNSEDYDGNWGIWDEPYLQYVVKQLSVEKEPFFTVVYTLSSHHPYKVPEKYKNILPKGEHEILQSIAYTDMSLKKFFEKAKKTNWFKNTLFVITADHVFGSHSEFYYRKIGSYSVPIAFFSESDETLKGVKNIISQHSDIMPSILDYLGIKASFICFGSSIWDTSATRFAINYINGSYLFLYDKFAVEFDGDKITGIFDMTTDSLMMNNIIEQSISEKKYILQLIKSIIQQYDNSLYNNCLTIRKYK